MQTAQQQAMTRKPILMPQDLIKKVDGIAQAKNISFAEVVRQAVNSFDEALSTDENVMLEAAVDAYLASTKEAIEKIDRLIERLDESHEILKEHAYGTGRQDF